MKPEARDALARRLVKGIPDCMRNRFKLEKRYFDESKAVANFICFGKENCCTVRLAGAVGMSRYLKDLEVCGLLTVLFVLPHNHKLPKMIGILDLVADGMAGVVNDGSAKVTNDGAALRGIRQNRIGAFWQSLTDN